MTARDAAARHDAGRRAPRDPRRVHRHRRHAVDARPAHRDGVRARWSGCARPAGSSSRSPAGPPDGAITSRGCGRSTRSSARTARSTCATTPRRAGSSRRFADDEPTRRAHRARLAAIGEKILAAVPGCALASDQQYRETDLAIDFREDVPPLAAGGRGPHRRADAGRGDDRESELDPRQRLVRRATTS